MMQFSIKFLKEHNKLHGNLEATREVHERFVDRAGGLSSRNRGKVTAVLSFTERMIFRAVCLLRKTVIQVGSTFMEVSGCPGRKTVRGPKTKTYSRSPRVFRSA